MKIGGRYQETENYIREVRISKGLTQKELGELAGVSKAAVGSLELGYTAPVATTGKNAGTVTKTAKRICRALSVRPEIMFPRYLCDMERSALTSEQVAEALGYRELTAEGKLIAREEAGRLWSIIGTWPPGRQKVFHLHFGAGIPLPEIAECLDLSGARVHQIVQTGLRLLWERLTKTGHRVRRLSTEEKGPLPLPLSAYRDLRIENESLRSEINGLEKRLKHAEAISSNRREAVVYKQEQLEELRAANKGLYDQARALRAEWDSLELHLDKDINFPFQCDHYYRSQGRAFRCQREYGHGGLHKWIGKNGSPSIYWGASGRYLEEKEGGFSNAETK